MQRAIRLARLAPRMASTESQRGIAARNGPQPASGASSGPSRKKHASWVAKFITVVLGPFLSAAPGVPQQPKNANAAIKTGSRGNPILAFIYGLFALVPRSLRELMSFKTPENVAHRLAQEVLEDVALEDTEETAEAAERAKTYVPGKQESATDPRIVRPPDVRRKTVAVGGLADPAIRMVELELESGPVEIDLSSWQPRLAPGEPVKTVFLMISGNPGVADFYNEFLTYIHENVGHKMAVFGVGHVGHSTLVSPPAHFGHSLAEQVQTKVALVKMLLEAYPEANIFIAGHSIGAWLASRVLAALESEPRIKGAYLLFPTLEHILLTPNGQRQHKMFKSPYKQLLSGLIHSMRSAMPLEALEELVGKLSHQPPVAAKITAHRLLSYSTVWSALTMSDDEMRDVAELDSGLFTRNASRIRGYYSTRDSWVPLTHYHNLKKRLEPLGHQDRLELDGYQLPHAFVLDSRDAAWMAQIVSGWLKEDDGKA